MDIVPHVLGKAVKRGEGDYRALVYLRRVRNSRSLATSGIVAMMHHQGVEVCYLKHGKEPITYSKRIGLI